MKIVFNIGRFSRGGAERVIANLSNVFAKDNEVYIVISGSVADPYPLDGRVKLLELDEKGYNSNAVIRNIGRIKRMKKMLLSVKPDIIVSFLPSPSYRVLLLKKALKCKIIVSDRNDPRHEYGGLLNRILCTWLYKRADGFVFQTNEQKEFFSKNIQKRSIVIPNPLKSEFLHCKVEKKKENSIISVGRFCEQKNQKLLIDAFAELPSKYKKYKLNIFGHGPLKKELLDYIADLGLSDKIILRDPVEEIKNELLKSKIFVMTSNYEGMPNALMEAMACGLPCISTDCPCGGPRELIKNGENGVLFEVGNKKQLVEKMEMLIMDTELREMLGWNAKKICNELDPKKIYGEWKKYIREIVYG